MLERRCRSRYSAARCSRCCRSCLSVTHPSCSGGPPGLPTHPIRHGESAERSARLPHLLMRVGRLSQGGQWPTCFRLVVRLLWCAPLSERGRVNTCWQQVRGRVSGGLEMWPRMWQPLQSLCNRAAAPVLLSARCIAFIPLHTVYQLDISA